MLEIACFNETSAITAAESGADRIELCTDYAVGGVTPPINSLHSLRKKISIPVNVMIRPRAGDFVYTDSEFEAMKEEIRCFKPYASGFVFGILDKNHHIDRRRNRELVELASPLPCTFHRAINQVQDLSLATEHVIECGFTSILTSGGPTDAVAGAETVGELHRVFGDRVTFILGGGVRSTNIGSLKSKAKLEWYHSAALKGPGEMVDGGEVERLCRLL
ncbi:uncharacterized protein EI97DRAFT_407717, partial [Westerdykella ornata]